MRTTKSRNWAFLVAFISLGFVLPSLAADEPKLEGLIDIDFPGAGEAKVEVNLAGALFSLAAKIVGKDDPEAAELLANLKSVKVRIYDEVALGGKSFDEVMSFYKQQLEKTKWEIMARVKDKESTVGVYALVKKDTVSGLVVLVGNPKEFIVVNLAGNIDLAKLSEIDDITGIDLNLPDNLDFKKRPTPEQKKKQEEQKKKATSSFFDGNPDRAIALLEELQEAGIGSDVDYGLIAVLYHSTGSLDKSYYYLGRLYESQHETDISNAFYKKALEINPQSEAAKRLSK
jgi:tetratricopeptide (TPR) repeat protein